ncbi:hypothetical protein Tco_0848297 [Tanacetum coccineum]
MPRCYQSLRRKYMSTSLPKRKMHHEFGFFSFYFGGVFGNAAKQLALEIFAAVWRGYGHQLYQKLLISRLNIGRRRKFKHHQDQILHNLRLSNPVSKNQPESALRIVGRLAPPHCIDTDTVIHNDGSHVQNDAMLDTVSKGTSSVMWKAFPSPVIHNV